MSKQIFKKIVPVDILYQFLDKICESTPSSYILNINSYKKMLYYNYHVDFLKELVPYYHISKQFYLKREITYNTMTTILRQICKSHQLKIESKMKYVDSNYIIEYTISVDKTVEYENSNDINT